MTFEVSVNGKRIVHSGSFLSQDYDNNKIKIRTASGFEFSIVLDFVKASEDKNGEIERSLSENIITYSSCVGENTRGIGIRKPSLLGTISGKEWFFSFWCSFEGEKKDIILINYSIYESIESDFVKKD